MSQTVKKALIDFLSQLEMSSLSATKQSEITGVVSHLSKPDIKIPASQKGEKQVAEFIELFFSAYPALMNISNRDWLEQRLGQTFVEQRLGQSFSETKRKRPTNPNSRT